MGSNESSQRTKVDFLLLTFSVYLY